MSNEREEMNAGTQSIEDTIEAHRVSTDIAASDPDHAAWNDARAIRLARYWSGEAAPPERQAEARVLWSNAALMARFVCPQAEPLVVNHTPQTTEKSLGLWDRDVCEIFVAPDARAPEKYFEFEAAPTGEWLDLKIRKTNTTRETDWQYTSGMSVAARINEGLITIVMRVPWTAFDLTDAPQAGTRWRANLFRCVGTEQERGYLAWQPTRTLQPNFHVPEAFGWLRFSGE